MIKKLRLLISDKTIKRSPMPENNRGWKSFIIIVILSIVSIYFTGCIRSGNKNNHASNLPEASVLVLEPELAQKLSIRSQKHVIDQHHIYIAMTELLNEGNSHITVQAQTFFKDNRGITVDRSDPRILTLDPQSIEHYHAASASEDIRHFVVFLKLASETKQENINPLIPPQESTPPAEATTSQAPINSEKNNGTDSHVTYNANSIIVDTTVLAPAGE
jgi:uncharacterized protein YcfL